MKKKKIIITGGAGFIGSHIAERYTQKNAEIIILDNLSTGRLDNIKKFKDKVTFIKCDLSKNGKWNQYYPNHNPS